MVESHKRDLFIKVILEMKGDSQTYMKELVEGILTKSSNTSQIDNTYQQHLDKIDELEEENTTLHE